ncbi:MAG: 2OG-Fe(II) oxygenase [Alphaproteobacteria bacterium]
MNIRPFYVYQKSVFPADFCDKVIAEGEKLQHTSGTVGMFEGERENAEIRSTELAFFPQEPAYGWLYDYILQFINAANTKYWNFKLSAVEPVQYGVYNTSQYYHWHVDQHPYPYKEGANKGLTRKLSFTMQLTDGDDYEGGDFELKDPGEENKVMKIDGIRARGSVIIFPSFIFHRVTPVTKGTRRSMVGWVIGPPFV